MEILGVHSYHSQLTTYDQITRDEQGYYLTRFAVEHIAETAKNTYSFTMLLF